MVPLSEWSLTKVTPAAGTPPTVSVVGSAKSVPDAVNGVPPSAGPEAGLIEKRMRCENSEVLPFGSVAVAEMRAPTSVVTGSVTSIEASPPASVVTWDDPR